MIASRLIAEHSLSISERIFRVGLALVLMLMLFVTWNDIVHVRGML